MKQARHHKDALTAKLRTIYPEIDAHGIDPGVRIAQLVRNFAGA